MSPLYLIVLSPEGFWFLTMGPMDDLRNLKKVVDLETY